jgi:hypothetical protein
MSARNLCAFSSFDSTKCFHHHRIESCHNRHLNCIECGVFLSHVNNLSYHFKGWCGGSTRRQCEVQT